MMKHKEYIIPFSGLKQGEHKFEYAIANKFFDSFGYDEFNDAAIRLTVILNKKSSMLELEFEGMGMVNVDCDITSEAYEQPISSKLDLVIKFGEYFNDDDDELLILPYGEYEVNIAQYIYEMLVLAVPQKRIHPGIAEGTLKSKALDRLNELRPRETKENSNENNPMWDELKNLL